jgi:4-amino-4-deoxy-L-arabinose transferase-like glycosyltransferase
MKRLALIIVLAAVVRLVGLASVPPHLSNDEISIAYDSYSLLSSGRDEHGFAFPVAFMSHGTYKAPLYAYLLTPLLQVLGNTDTAAKLPSAISGILTVLVFYLLLYALFHDSRLGLIGAFVLAVAPWHIYTSRMVLEANVALLFLAVGILLFLKKSFQLAGIISVFSMYAYHSEWFLAPFLILVFAVKNFRSAPKKILFMLLTVLVMVIPLGLTAWSEKDTGARANTEMVWKDARLASELTTQSGFSKSVTVSASFLNNYAGLFNPGALFFNGLGLFDKPGPFEQGLFLWPFVIPFFWGLARLGRFLKHQSAFFIIWLLASPVVTALTHDGNLIRNLASVLPFSAVIAIGLLLMIRFSRRLFLLYTVVIFSAFAFFTMIYFVHFPLFRAESYQGYRPLAQYLKASGLASSATLIDYRFGIYSQYSGVPHLYFGFYNRWDPRLAQHRINTPEGWFYGRFQVTWIDWNRTAITPGTIYIVSVSNPPTPQAKSRLRLKQAFVDVSGMPSFEIWQGI